MNPTQPKLHDLLARYLDRQSSAHSEGLGFAEAGAEMVPFDAVPVQPVEPRLAWSEALAVLRAFNLPADPRSCAVPADWPALVASHEPELGLPFCLGNFPQMVRHLSGLLHASDSAALRAPAGSAAASPELLAWAERTAQTSAYPQVLLAVAMLRLARQHEAAGRLLRPLTPVPAGWQGVVDNEEAALTWHRGALAEAAALWRSQAESVPVLFNRGLAALFLGEPAQARTCLGQAAAQLPEDGAWHHLARLYLALAEMRG